MTPERTLPFLAVCGVGVAAVALLTSCSTTRPLPDMTQITSPHATPTATTSPSPSAAATTSPTFLRDPDSAPWGVTTVPDEALVGHLTNYIFPVQLPRDGGAITYAEGDPITEGSKIVAYKVASGDIYDYIAKRFHLTNDGYLIVLNEVRRGEAAQLYAGDILNLSAYTLDKYGTINGHVVKGPQPLTAPHQEP